MQRTGLHCSTIVGAGGGRLERLHPRCNANSHQEELGFHKAELSGGGCQEEESETGASGAPFPNLDLPKLPIIVTISWEMEGHGGTAQRVFSMRWDVAGPPKIHSYRGGFAGFSSKLQARVPSE
jgi:hypothetical protein